MPDAEVTVMDDGARIEVVGGGVPSAEELAALVVALTPAVGHGAGADDGPRSRDEVPAWARAALLEGVGLPSPTRPSDLARAWLAG